MNDSGTIQNVAVAVIIHEGRYLVGVRPEGKPLAGYSEFPGGKCLFNEPTNECAERESLEETGLRVTAVELLMQHRHCYAHGEVDLSFWRCEISGSSSQPQYGYRWVTAEELGTLKFPEANAPLLKQLRH